MPGDSRAVGGGRRFDVAIIGAGPAGLAAAGVLCDHDLDVVVIDEQPRAGGQFLRQPPATYRVDDWLTAALYRHAKSALRTVENRTDITWMHGTTVLGLQPAICDSPLPGRHFDIWLQRDDGHEIIGAAGVLLASGCYERPLPVPGWTLPGVMGAGAIQAFVKSQQFVPGERFVLAGSHPLQLVVADQLTAAGARVERVIFTQAARRVLAVLRYPLAALRGTPQLAETAKILWRLRRARVPVLFGRSIAAIDGGDSVERVTVASLDREGRLDLAAAEDIRCDRLGLCHGFLASSELARQAGADTCYRQHGGGWLVRHDRWFQSSVAGLFAAGEITGLAGADASIHKGRIAAIGLLRELRRMPEPDAEDMAKPSRRELSRCDRFAGMLNELSRPPRELAGSSVTGRTIVCRCEVITHGDLLEKLDQHPHIASTDAAKQCTRAGMGACQGRFCGEHVMHTVMDLRGLTAEQAGTFEARFPVKPLALATLSRTFSPQRYGNTSED